LDAVARLDAHASLRARAASPYPAKELQLGTEALGLPCGQPRERGPLDAAGKAEEVLDHGGVAGLPTGDVPLEDDRGEPVRRSVDGRRQARGTGAHDGELVMRARGRRQRIP